MVRLGCCSAKAVFAGEGVSVDSRLVIGVLALSTDKLVVFTIRESAFEDEECDEEDADTNHAIFDEEGFLWCKI